MDQVTSVFTLEVQHSFCEVKPGHIELSMDLEVLYKYELILPSLKDVGSIRELDYDCGGELALFLACCSCDSPVVALLTTAILFPVDAICTGDRFC